MKKNKCWVDAALNAHSTVADHVWNLQRPCNVCSQYFSALSVRKWQNHRYCVGMWCWCLPNCTHLWR
jgi:hypothetical protein